MLSWHGVVLISALSTTTLAIIRHEVGVERADVVVCAPIINLSLCLHLMPATAESIAAVESRRLYTRELRLVRTSGSLHMLRLLLIVQHLLLLQLVRVRVLMLMFL